MCQGNFYRAFLHDVTAVMLVSQNNEMAAMLVSHANPVGFEVLSYVNALYAARAERAFHMSATSL